MNPDCSPPGSGPIPAEALSEYAAYHVRVSCGRDPMRPGLCPLALRMQEAYRSRDTKMMRGRLRQKWVSGIERVALITAILRIEGREDPDLRPVLVEATPTDEKGVWDAFYAIEDPDPYILLAEEAGRGNETAAMKLEAIRSHSDGLLSSMVCYRLLTVALAHQPAMYLRIAAKYGARGSLEACVLDLTDGQGCGWPTDMPPLKRMEIVRRVRDLPPQEPDVEALRRSLLDALLPRHVRERVGECIDP
ncbi:MAG: hypothetical protein HY898_18820 [Deltaproteobacteria bacterium]|nr:hypothetical protein [Deltaproteobacteria bacterium]